MGGGTPFASSFCGYLAGEEHSVWKLLFLLHPLEEASWCMLLLCQKWGSVGAAATYSQLLLPSWEQSLQKCYFFVFIGFVGNGLHTAWVCKPGVCSSEERIFAKLFFWNYQASQLTMPKMDFVSLNMQPNLGRGGVTRVDLPQVCPTLFLNPFCKPLGTWSHC